MLCPHHAVLVVRGMRACRLTGICFSQVETAGARKRGSKRCGGMARAATNLQGLGSMGRDGRVREATTFRCGGGVVVWWSGDVVVLHVRRNKYKPKRTRDDCLL